MFLPGESSWTLMMFWQPKRQDSNHEEHPKTKGVVVSLLILQESLSLMKQMTEQFLATVPCNSSVIVLSQKAQTTDSAHRTMQWFTIVEKSQFNWNRSCVDADMCVDLHGMTFETHQMHKEMKTSKVKNFKNAWKGKLCG